MKLANTPCTKAVVSAAVALALSSYAQAQSRVLEGPGVLDKKGVSQTILSAPGEAQGRLTDRTPSGAKILVNKIAFTGNVSYSAAELTAFLSPQLEKQYTLDELLDLTEQVTQFYRKNGYLVAKAVLPEQQIDGGTVNISIFEGRLSNIAIQKVQSPTDTRLDAGQMAQIFSLNFCGSERCDLDTLTQSRVDRAINLLEDVAGVKIVRADLRPGEAVGSTGIDIQVAPRAPYRLELGGDNFGNAATGRTRAQARLSANNALLTGDQFGFSYLGTDKTNLKYYGLDYSAPMGYMGWRWGGAAGRTHYVIPGAAAISGSADIRSLNVSYPIMRSIQSSMDFVAEYEHAKLSQDSTQIENKTRNGVRLGVSGAFLDQAQPLGRATNDWSLAVTRSDLSFENPALDTEGTSGSKTKLAWRFNRVQALNAQGWFAGLNAYGQFASGNLDPYAKLALGGAAGVRAYASGEAAGDEAVLTQLSLGKAWNSTFSEREFNLSMAGFYDRGWAHLQKNPTAVSGNSATRSGYGLEFQLSKKDAMSMRIFWAKASNGVSSYDAKGSRIGVNIGFAF